MFRHVAFSYSFDSAQEVHFVDAFTMEIAGLVVRVQPMFVTTREYCRDYLCDREPDFFVNITDDDLIYEQKMLDADAVEEGLKFR